MANNGVHENDIRSGFMERIGGLKSLSEGVKALQEFRKKYTTPLRESYELQLDCNWIECKLEEKVAVLKHHEFNDQDFQHKCATGEDAKAVAASWVKKMESCKDKWQAEKIHIQFRQQYKSPIMPTNYFMDADRLLGNRLMELRNVDYLGTSLPELRKQRGVREIVVPH